MAETTAGTKHVIAVTPRALLLAGSMLGTRARLHELEWTVADAEERATAAAERAADMRAAYDELVAAAGGNANAIAEDAIAAADGE